VLVAPLGISSLGLLTNSIVWSLEDHTDIKLGILLLYILDFTPVFRIPIAFTLQKNPIRKEKIRSVVMLNNIGHFGAFVFIRDTKVT
jgi:hypothetical protein